MKVKALFIRFLGTRGRKFDLCNYCCVPSLNLQAYFCSTKAITATDSDSGHSDKVSEVVGRVGDRKNSAAEVLRKFGCNESDIDKVFSRQPALRNANGSFLESKLNFLSKLGLGSSDLVKMVNCRPRFLSSSLHRYFQSRLDDLMSLFGSTELFLRAIVRNPSLLIYDFNKSVKPVVSLYEEMGVSRNDLISMLLLRPTLIPRTNMSEEKIQIIRKMKVSKESKMFKYVVTIMGVSRIETIREKVANLEKFGFSEDEVFELFGRSPLLMTLSLDKVQRNMTYLIGTMKRPAKSIFRYPFLLFCSLEDLLRPRVLLAQKIEGMDLSPQILGPKLFSALRMSEKRFLKAFIMCHNEDVKDELLDFYRTAKRMKRLAVSSKKTSYTNGFPF